MNVMRRNRIHGAKAGNRGIITRLRVSQSEHTFIHTRCEERGTTVAYAMRLALIEAGLLPADTPIKRSRPKEQVVA